MAEIRALDLVIDKTSGDQLYFAYQDITGTNLYVEQQDTSLALVGSAEDFGAATETEIDNETYYLKLYVMRDPTVTSNEDVIFAFGRMDK